MTFTLTTLALSIAFAQPEAAAYPRPDLLMEAADLAKPETTKKFLILDARSKDKYLKGHVPGALWVDHEAWNKAFYASQDPKAWAQRIGGAGIGNTTRVIVYDDALQKDAARIWWILRYFGAKDVRLLNGGFPGWVAAKQPLSTDEPSVEAKNFTIAVPAASRFATQQDVLKILEGKSAQILDTRSEKEHCGDEKLKNKKGGAIPGAMHLEWTEALDKKSQRFKSPGDLTKILKDAGVDLARPIVTHCQSGGRAAVMSFTLELMGARDVANYYRGWSEWGNQEDSPIVRPTPKKK